MLRKLLSKLSIRWKIVLITTVSCAVILTASMAILVASHLLLQRADAKSQLSMLAEITSLNAASAVIFEDASSAEATLESLSVVPGIRNAGILAEDGKPFATLNLTNSDTDAYAPPPDHPNFGILGTWRTLTVFAPIRHDDALLGTVYIHYGLDHLHGSVLQYTFNIVGLMLVGLGIAILLSWRLQRLATASLLRLNTTIQRIAAQQDFSIRAERQSDDEVGELIDGFNLMLDMIQQRDDALKKHRENLETEVRERTEELQSKNQALKSETEQRRSLVEELRRRIRIEKLISSVSTQFLAISADELSAAVDEALQKCGTLAEVDAAFAATLAEDCAIANVHHWSALANAKGKSLSGLNLKQELPWLHSQLQTGKPLQIVELDDIPPEAERERMFLAQHNVRSLLCLPMVYRETLVGTVGLATVTSSRAWTDEEVHLVRLLGEIILGTLERQWSEESRKRLEEQVRQAQKLESLGVLTGGIAHDFNNLLMGILGNAELAEDEAQTSSVNEALENIQSGAKQAADLCRQMLAYAGHGRIVIQSVDINNVLRTLADLLKTSISKKAELTLQLGDDLPPVRADVSQIRQVVMNLITNAAEAVGDAEGRITVRTSKKHCTREFLARTYLSEDLDEGDFVVLDIIDTGPGMDSETLERIFDPFFTTKFTGRGLGLAAVLGIVRSHGAALDVYSNSGQGTRFTLYLPAESADDVDSLPDQPAESPADWRGEGTVLVAEDESSVRFTVMRMLKKLGLKVLEAQNGFETVECLKRNPSSVDLLILDLNMPRMNGYEALCEIRSFAPDLPVLLSSGYSEEESTRDFSSLNLSGFIEKPYSLDQLVRAVRAILDDNHRTSA